MGRETVPTHVEKYKQTFRTLLWEKTDVAPLGSATERLFLPRFSFDSDPMSMATLMSHSGRETDFPTVVQVSDFVDDTFVSCCP